VRETAILSIGILWEQTQQQKCQERKASEKGNAEKETVGRND
jgi:hypothetical protein